MMLPEEENGLLLNEQQIQDLRESRKNLRCWLFPQSLYALAIQSVFKHLTRFIGVPDCPLKYLPNTIVQKLLSKITSEIQKKKMLTPLPLLMQVLGLLVNPSVTELDCRYFDWSHADTTVGNYLLKHALENCPNIRKIRGRNKLKKYLSCGSYSYYQGLYVSPFECFKKSWKNLTTIIMSEGDCRFDECAMRFLQENFPNIEELHVCIYINYSSKTMVNHFVKMKRLHTLYLREVFGYEYLYNKYDPEMIQFFANVAGGVPNLRNFGFAEVEFGEILRKSKFIDLFGEKYPSKNIQLMDKLRIKEGLERKWPKNVSVSRLKIDATNWSDTEIENLSTIECKLDLTVSCELAQQMYQVLDCIGGLVKSLAIKNRATIILERILAACPNLEHFNLIYVDSMVLDPEYNMLPAAFKNYKSFEFDGWNDNYVKEVAFQQVYRKFLIGTEVCESLDVLNYEHLQAVAQVALEYPKSLQQLRELNCYSFFHDEMNEAFDKYDKCFYVLLTCCHKLERIFFRVHGERLSTEVDPVNRYLATIQSIDPHFIQKYS